MRDYSISYHQSPPRRDFKLLKKILFLGIFFLLLFFVGKFIIGGIVGFFQKPSAAPQVAGQTTKNSEDVLGQIKKVTDGSQGTFSVYVYDINQKRGFGTNEQMVFTGASVNKIPILASLYSLASGGDIDLEETITPQDDDIQDYGTGSIRYDPTGTPYSIRTLARLMMEKSDNTAAHILGKIVLSEAKVQELVDSWGLTQTSMSNNKTSNADMQKLLTKMYTGEITSSTLTPEMLGLMTRSDFDDRIPNGLPAGTKLYHKTGDEVAKIHDVGIVDLPGRPYYIGVFTTDMKDEKKAKQDIAQISKIVYEYFTSM